MGVVEVKLLIMAGVCTLAAGAAVATLPSAAYASESDASAGGPPLKGFLAPAAMRSKSVSPLLIKEMSVITNEGIAPARAWQAIGVQGRVGAARLQARLEADMGETFAGVWFEPATAQLHVGVTSTEGRQKAVHTVAAAGLAGDITFTTVRSTWRQLLATQSQWNDRLAHLFALGAVQTALEPQRNAVNITISSALSASTRARIEREAEKTGVDVLVEVVPGRDLIATPSAATKCNKFATLEAYCSKPITSGVTTKGAVISCEMVAAGRGVWYYETKAECEERKKSGKEGTWFQQVGYCTAGPLAVTANKKKRYVLTAGHCINGETEHWFAINTKGEEGLIGPAREFSFGVNGGEKGATECKGKCDGGDYGELEIEQSGSWNRAVFNNPVFAVTAEWKKAGEISYPVKGERAPATSMTSCHEGQTSGESCGKINQVNVTLSYVTGCELLTESKMGEKYFSSEPTCLNFESVGGEGTWERKSYVVTGLVKVEAARPEFFAEKGDSGGPFLFIEANNEALMEGIYSGQGIFCKENGAESKGEQFFGAEAECRNTAGFPTGGMGKWERKQRAWFFPVDEALGKLKLELLTSGNEVVPPTFEPATKQKVTGTSGTAKLVAAGDSVTCSSDESSGEVSSATLIGSMVIHFAGCKSAGPEKSNCTAKSVGASEGAIVTSTLHAILGTTLPLPESGSEVGLLLLPSSGKTITELAANTCTVATKVTGTVAGLVEPVGVSQRTEKVIFGVTSGKQNVKDIDLSTGLVAPELVAFGAAATEETTESLTYEKAVEVV
jgi:hypothetical protein